MKLNNFDIDVNRNGYSPQKLLLKACCASTSEEQKILAEEWEDCVVMDDLDYGSLRLAPLFLYKNERLEITTKHDKRLKIVYKHWWLKTRHVINELANILGYFEKEGVESIIIKGASILSYYDRPEHRPVADFALLIKPDQINVALEILKKKEYAADRKAETMLRKHKALFIDFSNSIECLHPITNKKIFLHWRPNFLSSWQLTDHIWKSADDYEMIAGAKKPKLAFEALMLIIDGVTGQNDDQNWMVDIHRLNLQTGKSFWTDAYKIAKSENMEDLLDYGCAVLLDHGIYAPTPLSTVKPSILSYFNHGDNLHTNGITASRFKLNQITFPIRYLFPYSSALAKYYHTLRRIWLLFILKKVYS